jgi:hypothetical protein
MLDLIQGTTIRYGSLEPALSALGLCLMHPPLHSPGYCREAQQGPAMNCMLDTIPYVYR